MKEILGVKLYDIDEVATLLGVRRAAAYQYAATGRIKYQTIGGKRYVTEEAIREFIFGDDHQRKEDLKKNSGDFSGVDDGPRPFNP